MKVRILLALFGAAALVVGVVLYANGNQRSDKELLADLQKLSTPPDLKVEKIETAKDLKELLKKRGEEARALLKQFEAKHAKSPLLHDARAEALKALTMGQEPQPGAVEVATSLVADAPKGSEQAAEGDVFLKYHEIKTLFAGVKSASDFKGAWHKNAEVIRKHTEALLATYPKFKPAADFAAHILQMADEVDDEQTHRLILDLALKHFPSHELAKIANREKAVGKEFAFEYTAVGSDKKTSLKDLRGKVVVLDFWATWCPPCKAEIPAMKVLYEKYKDKGLEIIGVSLDQKEAALTDYVKDKGVLWPQVFGKTSRALADEWGIEGIPAVFIIDRQGRLHSLKARGKLDKLVPELLAEK